MKLEFMRLTNWRSFYGANELWFSTNDQKNVTLIRAENGVGKTSLLAALNWCFFKILPTIDEFENPDKIVNDQSEETQAKIEVEFNHDGKQYKAVRTYNQEKKQASELRLLQISHGVETPVTNNPDRFINSVIPREMAPHFFFYGELKYSGQDGSKKFGKAVQSILGSTVANKALLDLEKAMTDYDRQAADNTTDEAVELHRLITDCDEQIEKIDNLIDQAENEEIAAQDIIDELSKQLSGTESIKKDQHRRTILESSVLRNKTKLGHEEDEAKKWFHRYGAPLLSKSFIEDVETLLSSQDTKKRIPGPYNEKFVNDILEDNECICGQPLVDGSDAHKRIKSLLDTATDEVMIARVISTSAALGKLKGKSEDAWSELHKSENNCQIIAKEIATAEDELEDISGRLKNSEISSIAEKETSLQSAKSARRQAVTKQGAHAAHKEDIQRKQSTYRQQQGDLFSKSTAAKRFKKRRDLSRLLVNRLKGRLKDEELFARIEIKKKIDHIIERFMRKSLTVKIDENYRMKVTDKDGVDHSKSTGENQILALAFTGAIAAFAKERRADESDILLSGTEAPLVIDSPFGQLDTTHSEGVANFLPELASQVILLVSTKQASNEILAELDEKIGAQAVLTRFNTEAQGPRKEETVKINGNTFELTKYDQEFSGTKIIEVQA